MQQSLPKLAREFLEASVAERNRELEERQIQQQRELEVAQELARTEAERAELAESRVREQEAARLRELESTNKLRRRAVAVAIAAAAALILLIVAVVMWRTAQDYGRNAIRQLGNVDWLLGARARDDKKDVLRSGHFFLKAAKDFQSVGEAALAKSATLAGTLGNRALVCTFLPGGDIHGAVFNRDESRILTWSEDGTAWLWAVGQNEPIQTFKHEESVNGAVFNRDESRILTWTGDSWSGGNGTRGCGRWVRTSRSRPSNTRDGSLARFLTGTRVGF